MNQRRTPDLARWRGLPWPTALLLLAGLAVAVACGGDGTGPGGIQVTRQGDQQQGAATAPLPLPIGVRVTNASGQPRAGVSVTWAVTSGGGSVSPTMSTTDSDGVAQTMWTLGPDPGQQTATATIAGAEVITFTAVASPLPLCDELIDLPVGGSCIATPARAAEVGVSGGPAGAEFTAIPYNNANFSRTATSVRASVAGGVAVTGPPTPTIVPEITGFAGEAVPTLMRDYSFERRLRQRERRELPALVAAARARRADALRGRLDAAYMLTPTEPRFATVGDQVTFNTNSQAACTNPINKTGTVRRVTTNAIIVADNDNPAGGFTDADYEQIGNAFESVVWPTDIAAFGQPTDIDGNGRVIIFFTIEVNKLTPPNSPSFVGGFFFSRDLFPRTQQVVQPSGKTLTACPASNVAEMFYMLAPDPDGVFGNVRSVDGVRQATPGTIAHELQHLINAARRLYINATAAFPEQVWLDEGIAHIAEELAYYRASGFAPRQNIDSTALRQQLDAVNTYQLANLSRFRNYVRATHSQSAFGETSFSGQTPDDWDDLETRGAIWSFLRWAADNRGPGGDGDTWSRLVNSADTGVRNLRGVFGNDVGSRMRDWAVAHYTDDAVNTGVSAFTHPSWNYRSVLPLLENPMGPPRRYQLNVIPLTGVPANFQLVDGGALYFRFGVPASGTGTVRMTTQAGGLLPAGTSVWFVRTK